MSLFKRILKKVSHDYFDEINRKNECNGVMT